MSKSKELPGSHRYDDILYCERPVSTVHPKMSLYDRAAQFSAFSALTGYSDVIGETARYTESDLQMDESCFELLNEKLNRLAEKHDPPLQASVTYYEPDARKQGGAFLTIRGQVRKIEEYERTVQFADGTRVPIDRIRDIQILPTPD